MQVLALAIQEGAKPAENIKAFRKKHGLSYPILSDEPGDILAKFGFDGIPSNVILDKKDHYVAHPDSPEEIATELKKLTK